MTTYLLAGCSVILAVALLWAFIVDHRLTVWLLLTVSGLYLFGRVAVSLVWGV